MASFDEVKTFLASHGIRVLEFDVKTPTAETAAVAVGCSPAEIAKSVLLLVGEEPVLVVTCGDRRVNSSRLKKMSGLSGKVKLPNPDQVIHFTGYAPGGVCPFLLPADLTVFLDNSLRRFATIYPAAGNDHSAVPVECQRLEHLTGGIWGELSVLTSVN